MPLSWNEIKNRAHQFSREFAGETNEDAEAKSFWDGFFHIFGISRRRIATFEHLVQKLGGKAGFIDLLWKGTINLLPLASLIPYLVVPEKVL